MTESKLQTLTKIEGYDDPIAMLEAEFDSGYRPGVPGICSNPGCDYSKDVEPDSKSGWCESCESNTVVSTIFLLGAISQKGGKPIHRKGENPNDT